MVPVSTQTAAVNMHQANFQLPRAVVRQVPQPRDCDTDVRIHDGLDCSKEPV